MSKTSETLSLLAATKPQVVSKAQAGDPVATFALALFDLLEGLAANAGPGDGDANAGD